MYSIGQLSQQTGTKVPTIRYYEDIGLIAAFDRTEGNQRRFDPKALKRLTFIRHGRDLGLSLDFIRDLLDLDDQPGRPCAEVHTIVEAHLRDIRDRISQLQRLEQELARIVRASDDGLTDTCHVLEALADHGHCHSDH